MMRFVSSTLKYWHTVPKPRDKSRAISAGLAKSLAYLEVGKVQNAEAHLKGLKDIAQAAEPMV